MLRWEEVRAPAEDARSTAPKYQLVLAANWEEQRRQASRKVAHPGAPQTKESQPPRILKALTDHWDAPPAFAALTPETQTICLCAPACCLAPLETAEDFPKAHGPPLHPSRGPPAL
jgi:hypothetical protein